DERLVGEVSAVEQPDAGTDEGDEVAAAEEPPLIADPVPSAVLKTPSEGLESIPQYPKRVIIVGGGIAGLVAGFELARQGHDPLILEAQHRVGGRIYTLRDFAPGLYAEAGKEGRERYRRIGEEALQQVIDEYDRYSIREFLTMRGFSEGAIELYGVMSFREANLGAAVIEQLREIIGRAFDDMQEVVGGMDRLTDAFYHPLRDRIRFGARVVAVEQGEDSVTVHYTTRAGRFSETGDYAVCTLPFSVLG